MLIPNNSRSNLIMDKHLSILNLRYPILQPAGVLGVPLGFPELPRSLPEDRPEIQCWGDILKMWKLVRKRLLEDVRLFSDSEITPSVMILRNLQVPDSATKTLTKCDNFLFSNPGQCIYYDLEDSQVPYLSNFWKCDRLVVRPVTSVSTTVLRKVQDLNLLIRLE